MKNKEKKKSILLTVSEELYEQAKKKSKETGVPITFILRKALEKWIGE